MVTGFVVGAASGPGLSSGVLVAEWKGWLCSGQAHW